MPTVLRQNGFSLMIYTRDHEPMHVHVWYQGSEAVIRFETEIFCWKKTALAVSKADVRWQSLDKTESF